MSFKYQSGEEIKKGDVVLYFNDPGEIELVAEPPGDSETDWYVQEYGGGVMIKETTPKNFGRVFLTQTHKDCCLVFVSRKKAAVAE